MLHCPKGLEHYLEDSGMLDKCLMPMPKASGEAWGLTMGPK